MRNRFIIALIPFSLLAVMSVMDGKAYGGGANSGEARLISQEDGFKLTADDRKISLVANNSKLKEILKEMGRLLGAEIALGSRVSGKITDSFDGLTAEEAIKRLVGSWAMVFEEDEERGCKLIRCVIPNRDDRRSKTSETEFKTGASAYAADERSILQNGRLPGAEKDVVQDGSQASSLAGRFVPGEVLVRFKTSADAQAIQGLLRSSGLGLRKYNSAGRHHVLGLPENLPVREAIQWLSSQEIVDVAEPNFLMQTQAVPDDPEYAEQWALDNIRASEAWEIERGLTEVVIAVIDTGVDYTHPDLAENIWHNSGEIPNNGVDDDGNTFIDDDIGWDFVETAGNCGDDDCGGRDRDPMDGHGHGTHVAGIAGAVANNGVGVAGVAWHCKIMAVRAGYRENTGDGVLEVDDAVSAIHYACDNGAHVLNLSWGASATEGHWYSILEDAIDYAGQKGVLVCAAAGNKGSSVPFYPAAYDDPAIIAVGSTNRSDNKADSSSFGDWVDLSAPGADIVSTFLSDGYRSQSGTSMATPHVAGLAGLLFSRFPGWPANVIKAQILGSVLVVSYLEGVNATSGIIDCYDALDLGDGDCWRFMEGLAESFGGQGCGGEYTSCAGDSDGDGDVDGADLADFVRKLSD